MVHQSSHSPETPSHASRRERFIPRSGIHPSHCKIFWIVRQIALVPHIFLTIFLCRSRLTNFFSGRSWSHRSIASDSHGTGCPVGLSTLQRNTGAVDWSSNINNVFYYFHALWSSSPCFFISVNSDDCKNSSWPLTRKKLLCFHLIVMMFICDFRPPGKTSSLLRCQHVAC